MIASFAPLEPPHAIMLILGTMPSVQSLEKQQYYGNGQNHFWRLLFSLWDEPVPGDYQKRCAFVLNHRIALWDVLQSCDRQGSMDHSIQNALPNDIPALLKRQPGIRAVFFNSKNAATFFSKLIGPRLPAYLTGRELSFTTLPSSSPARAMAFSKKLEQWQVVRTTWDTLEQQEKTAPLPPRNPSLLSLHPFPQPAVAEEER